MFARRLAAVCLQQLISAGAARVARYVWSAGGGCRRRELYRKQLRPAYGKSLDADSEDICGSTFRLRPAKSLRLWRLALCRQNASHGMLCVAYRFIKI